MISISTGAGSAAPSCTVRSIDATDRPMAGAGVTVTVAVPTFPSVSALTTAVPGATPVTNPVEDTTATPMSLEVHVNVGPSNATNCSSRAAAISCTVLPAVTDAVSGEMVTTSTTGGSIRNASFSQATPAAARAARTAKARRPAGRCRITEFVMGSR